MLPWLPLHPHLLSIFMAPNAKGFSQYLKDKDSEHIHPLTSEIPLHGSLFGLRTQQTLL